jgi:hypothetical protein
MKGKGKATSGTRRGHGAYGRELSKQRMLDDAVMRLQGEDLEAGRYAEEMMGGGMVKGYRGGGCVMAGRGGKFKGVM